ncbi:unnamed protein product [Effrenium voratum]|nr:unnamed protein product [Effrenium voratum]
MALALFGQDDKPKWFLDDLKKQPKSLTSTTCEMQIMGSQEALTMPIQQSTTVHELKMYIAMKMGIDPGSLTFVMKQGCSWRVQADNEEAARKVFVKGIRSFSRERHVWPNPIAIIGTGHAGLRQAMWFIKNQEFNFVVYDRKARLWRMARLWADGARDGRMDPARFESLPGNSGTLF